MKNKYAVIALIYRIWKALQTSDYKKVKLSKNEYFVLGDNREDSMDSRYYGPINKKNIKGSTKLILFPFNKFGFVK